MKAGKNRMTLTTQEIINGLRNLSTFTKRTSIPLGDDVVTSDGIQSLDVFGALAVDLGLVTVEWIEEVGPHQGRAAFRVYKNRIKELRHMVYEPVYGTPLWKQLLNEWHVNHDTWAIVELYSSVAAEREGISTLITHDQYEVPEKVWSGPRLTHIRMSMYVQEDAHAWAKKIINSVPYKKQPRATITQYGCGTFAVVFTHGTKDEGETLVLLPMDHEYAKANNTPRFAL